MHVLEPRRGSCAELLCTLIVHGVTHLLHLDKSALRVLAHPLRSRLLTQLRLHGPATATELAALLVTNTGATSYHLRKLESVGLVSDTGQGAGKRRVWQAATRGHEWDPSEFAGDPDAEASLAWLTDYYRSFHAERAEQWAAHEHEWPGHWRDAIGSADDGVLVTAAQAGEMRDEVLAVIRRYRDAGDGDPEAVRIHVYADLYPFDAHPPQEHQ